MHDERLLYVLRSATASALHHHVKAQKLPQTCSSLGLRSGDEAEAFSSKRRYVETRLPEGPGELVALSKRVLDRFPFVDLQEGLWKLEEVGCVRITELTRRKLVDELALLAPLSGRLALDTFLQRVWPLDQMSSSDPRCANFAGDLAQHMFNNDDWTVEHLLERLDVLGCSEKRFLRFLEELVHPAVRREDEQCDLVASINQHLVRDGLQLRATGQMSGHPIYSATSANAGVVGAAKNLIFASTGPKPELVLKDAINNDVLITKNAEYCLVYDRQVPASGLRWSDLVAWWAELMAMDPASDETGRTLYQRLAESLASVPERVLFKTYFELYREVLARAPALVPQVYLHFDPLTARQRESPVLARQRMDFLLLLSSHERVVVEVDGKHHYAQGDAASPRYYAEMVSADRELKLDGYEVYRFGGAELSGPAGKAAVKNFFTALFKKHRVLLSA